MKNIMVCLYPPTQETTALAVEECVTLEATIVAMNLLCFGGFRRRRWRYHGLCPWGSILLREEKE